MHTLAARKIVFERNKNSSSSSQKSWCAVNVQLLRFRAAFKVAKHTGLSTSTLNASFAAVLLSGSVGATLIFVRAATLDNARETTLASYL